MLAIGFVLLTASYTILFDSVARFRGDKRSLTDITMGREPTATSPYKAALNSLAGTPGSNPGGQIDKTLGGIIPSPPAAKSHTSGTAK